MSDLPEIHEIQRWKPEPGDILIVRNTEIEIDQQQAWEIKRAVRREFEMPDLKILVLGRDWEAYTGPLPEDGDPFGEPPCAG